MGFQCGIVGLPNVGKSTLFNALTSAKAPAANYPFCTIDPNVGRVDVPDPRLKEISTYVATKKIIPTFMEFVDIAGLVRGASKGEGLGNQFLGHIRSTDAIAHVVRCFESSDITHVDGSIDPLRDIATIDTELIFSDIETVEKNLDRTRKLAKSGDKKILACVAMLEALASHLQGLKAARSFDLQKYVGEIEEVGRAYRDLHLITGKPVLYVCNVSEEDMSSTQDNELTAKVRAHARDEGAPVVVICSKIEEELADLDAEGKAEMIRELGMSEPGLDRLIRSGYEALGLRTYFTAGEIEVRAWTIHRGDKAPAAAGKIHSDFEKGFICAEVFTLEDLRKVKTRAKLKEAGLLRVEGKEYVVQDGDIMEFRFNV